MLFSQRKVETKNLHSHQGGAVDRNYLCNTSPQRTPATFDPSSLTRTHSTAVWINLPGVAVTARLKDRIAFPAFIVDLVAASATNPFMLFDLINETCNKEFNAWKFGSDCDHGTTKDESSSCASSTGLCDRTRQKGPGQCPEK